MSTGQTSFDSFPQSHCLFCFPLDPKSNLPNQTFWRFIHPRKTLIGDAFQATSFHDPIGPRTPSFKTYITSGCPSESMRGRLPSCIPGCCTASPQLSILCRSGKPDAIHQKSSYTASLSIRANGYYILNVGPFIGESGYSSRPLILKNRGRVTIAISSLYSDLSGDH